MASGRRRSIRPRPAGPTRFKISGKQTVELQDVLVGDVWICAGQSNMQFGLGQARNGAEEVKNANYPQMRFYNVGERDTYSPADVPRGGPWRVITPEGLGGRGGGLSAAAYFFGRKVFQSVHVPIGLMQVAVGGVPAETFASVDALRPLKDFDDRIAFFERLRQKGGREYGNYIMPWYEDYDIGQKNGSWADAGLDDSVVEDRSGPGRLQGAGCGRSSQPDLVCARRSRFPIPLPQGRARIYLGQVEKMDTVYVNGRQVGSSSWVENPRVYGAVGLKPGKNVITIRLFRVQAAGRRFPRRRRQHETGAGRRHGDSAGRRMEGQSLRGWPRAAACCRPDTKA